MTAVTSSSVKSFGWRTPAVVIVSGCLVALLSFGPRSSLGQFLTPISMEHGWDREVFSLALALQNILWGLGQPFAGGLADKYGAPRVLSVGGLLYAAGLLLMTFSDTPAMFNLSAGVLIGFGLSGSSFSLVIGALGKLVPEEKRMMAFGLGTAAGSFGQFLFSPMARLMIDGYGWQFALMVFAALMMLVIPLAQALAAPPRGEGVARAMPQQSAKQALMEAFGHRSYVLLVIGFFTCGFQLAFVTVHLPAYMLDRGLSAQIGAMTIGIIGLCNIFGSMFAGYMSGRVPKNYVLSAIYFGRGVAIVAFMLLPATTGSAILFGAVTGFLWLSTVPPTNGLIAVMFGTRWLTMLSGAAFMSHQIGSFLGVWLGGFVFVHTGSYDPVWYLSIFFCVMSSLINLPIVEKPIVRAEMQAA